MSSGRRQGLYRHQSTISDEARSITATATDRAAGAPGTGHYAEVNGINLYFETRGAGRPLILLHGGLGSGEMFGPVLPVPADDHQVVAVDLQGHGRTATSIDPLTSGSWPTTSPH